MKNWLVGLLFLFASTFSLSQEVDSSKISCQNFSAGVYAMAQKVEEEPTIVTPKELLKAVGVQEQMLKDYPEAAKLVTLAARMVLTTQGRKYSPEDHQQGSEVMCMNYGGEISAMNHVLTELLKTLDKEHGGGNL